MKTPSFFRIISFATLTLAVGMMCNVLYAQNVGINATGAAPSVDAMLDIASTNKALLIPRVSIANLATIAPITGGSTESLLVYNTNVGTGKGFYYWDGLVWVKFFTGNPLVDNGLYYNTGANRVRLGGALVENTTITQGIYSLNFNLSSTGDFKVQDAGVTHFLVRDDGLTFFGDDTYWRDGSTGGITLARLYDSGNDGIFQVYMNGAVQHSINSVGTTVFNEQSVNVDFRIESNLNANAFFVDASTNRIGIRNGAPGYYFHMLNGGVNIGATSMARFENQGSSGVSLTGYNTGTTNGYNGAEMITAGIYSGVMGLGITTGSGGDGVFGTSNDWQSIGVRGSRFNSGGANTGWGAYFFNDVGYTGWHQGISDSRVKKNVNNMEGALDMVMNLRPITFEHRLEEYPLMGLPEGVQYGFVAQEVMETVPNVVHEKLYDTEGARQHFLNEDVSKFKESEKLFYGIDELRLISILAGAVQEQQTIIEDLKKRIEELEK